VAAHQASPIERSVAVMTFANITREPTDDWIGTGIAESLAADLNGFVAARLVPRARVAGAVAADPKASPSALGTRLGCRWAVSGSFQKLGAALRVVMELTHVPTERSVFVEKVDGTLDDLFAIQDRLGERVAAGLELGERTGPSAAAAAPALGAYECYTRGRQHWIRMAKGEFDRAHELYDEAVRQEPGYAEALAGLGAVHALRFTFPTDRAELDAAIGYTGRALECDANHVEAHVWRAYALWRKDELDGALAAIERAEGHDPPGPYPPNFHACKLLSMSRPEPALPLYQKAVDLSPGFGFAWLGLGWTHERLGHPDEARFCLERAIELETRGFHATAGAGGYLGEVLRRAGRLDAARAACLAGLEAVEKSDHMYRDTFRAICLNALGRVSLERGEAEAARAAYQQCVLHLGGRPRTLGGGHLACQALAGLARAGGDPGALEQARRAYADRAPGDWSWLWLCEDWMTLEDLNAAGGLS
jgi:TolB-like protein